MANYYDTARRWRDVCLGITDKPNLKNDRLIARGDSIFSYGSHFEIARALRDNRGGHRGWLINGDRFSNTTSKHQAEVRGAINAGMSAPQVIIPYSALQAASILFDTIGIVHAKGDWQEVWQETSYTFPDSAKWMWETEQIPGSGGWHHTKTNEWDHSAPSWSKPKEPNPADRWRSSGESYEEFEERVRLHIKEHGQWEWVDYERRNTGHKSIRDKRRSWIEWDLIDFPDSPTGVAYVREHSRHRLGESLITAKVQYRGRQKCRDCQGTGIVEPYSEQFADDEGYGPLTASQERWAPDFEHYRESVKEGWVRRHRTVAATRMTTRCATCGGARWNQVWRQRQAYFLSGFDANEARTSYFFCELPPGVRPMTVAEAYDTLKPQAVITAEALGRDVMRQGDIYWIPMPDLTTKDLKAQGRFTRREVKYEPRAWGPPRAISYSDASVLSTNHTVTEKVQVGRLTYAKGIMRHEPDGRQPDHARIKLGDGKTWGLVVKNTVPIGA
jgi:hypothetical protein